MRASRRILPGRADMDAQSRRAAAQQAMRTAIRRAVDRGLNVPCLVETEPLWLSDRRTERTRAARLCGDCPVLGRCAALADTLPITFGVWGGKDHAPTSL